MADDPHHEDRIVYTIVAVAFWVIVGLLLAGVLLNRGQSTWGTVVMAVGLALGLYSWFGKGRIADGVRFPGRIISAMISTGSF